MGPHPTTLPRSFVAGREFRWLVAPGDGGDEYKPEYAEMAISRLSR